MLTFAKLELWKSYKDYPSLIGAVLNLVMMNQQKCSTLNFLIDNLWAHRTIVWTCWRVVVVELRTLIIAHLCPHMSLTSSNYEIWNGGTKIKGNRTLNAQSTTEVKHQALDCFHMTGLPKIMTTPFTLGHLNAWNSTKLDQGSYNWKWHSMTSRIPHRCKS